MLIVDALNFPTCAQGNGLLSSNNIHSPRVVGKRYIFASRSGQARMLRASTRGVVIPSQRSSLSSTIKHGGADQTIYTDVPVLPGAIKYHPCSAVLTAGVLPTVTWLYPVF